MYAEVAPVAEYSQQRGEVIILVSRSKANEIGEDIKMITDSEPQGTAQANVSRVDAVLENGLCTELYVCE